MTIKVESGDHCPLMGKTCIGLQCAWITQIRGNDPQTGKEIDEWDCAVKWMPTLLIENSNQQRHTSAAVESFRNVVAANPVSILMGSKDAKPILDITNDES